MGTISKNFSYYEFEASATADRLGIINNITTVQVRNSVCNLVTRLLQPLRDVWQKPMKINSGYRSPALNKEVGGSSTSQHVKGEACDIHTGNQTDTLKMAKLVLDAGLPFDQMILYPTFLHLSLKLDGKQRRQVLYNSKWRGEKII